MKGTCFVWAPWCTCPKQLGADIIDLPSEKMLSEILLYACNNPQIGTALLNLLLPSATITVDNPKYGKFGASEDEPKSMEAPAFVHRVSPLSNRQIRMADKSDSNIWQVLDVIFCLE